MERTEVYKLIDGERDYQNKLWNSDTTISQGQHSVAEWLVYMQDYLSQAMNVCTRHADPYARDEAMKIVRKIAGMCVCAMEQIETEPR